MPCAGVMTAVRTIDSDMMTGWCALKLNWDLNGTSKLQGKVAKEGDLRSIYVNRGWRNNSAAVISSQWFKVGKSHAADKINGSP